jgi:hypothetical protein
MHVLLIATPSTRARTRARGTTKRTRRTAPEALLLGADSGSRAAGVLELQQTYGNRAVSLLMRTYDGNGNGNAPSISLHGQTTPSYDGGTSKILNPQVKRAKGCDCPVEEPCLTGTGTLQVTYKVDVTIVMPGVPGGLTACQERRVRAFLRDVLGPHEQDHARRLRSYDGTTRRPLTVKACGRQQLDTDVQSKIQQMHDDEHNQRATDADAKSAAIDPFQRKIDLNCK